MTFGFGLITVDSSVAHDVCKEYEVSSLKPNQQLKYRWSSGFNLHVARILFSQDAIHPHNSFHPVVRRQRSE